MADYTLVAKLTANAEQFVSGFKKAEETVANLQGKVTASGKRFQDLGNKVSAVGSSLTRKLTVPAAAATLAVGGITAALGWKRLVGLDTAQAQLKGLGYNTEEVGRISEQVTSAIDGGMTTMAEGTAIAAGALAAGVKEGKELEKYITLVGDAAVGANRPVDEMAQIFNRVQGQGKLMTQELNMIEMGLPGFAQAMADNVADGSMESFREMVTAGEVGSDEFLNVMDDFAGGMANAYSDSWAGMVKNTAAYIGIIGENLLEGVFQTSKEEIAGFIEVLKSDAVLDWAKGFGAQINGAFTSVIDGVRSAKGWFDSLSPTIQSVMTKGAAIGAVIAVGIGPAISVTGMLISAFGTVQVVIGALTGPVGIAIAVIVALIAAGIALYKNWDTVKEKAVSVFSHFEPLLETVKGAFQKLQDSVNPILENLKTLWQSLVPIFEMVGAVIGGAVLVSFGLVVAQMSAIVAAVGPVISALINLVDFVVNVFNAIIALITGDFSGAWEYWQDAAQSAFDFFVNIFTGIIDYVMTFVEVIIDYFYGLYMTLVGNSIIPDMVEAIVEWFQNMFQWVIDIVMMIVDGVVEGFKSIYELVSSYIQMVSDIIMAVWGYIQDTFKNALTFLVGLVTGDFGKMKGAIQSQMQNAQNLLKNIWNAIDGFLTSVLGGIWGTVKSVFAGIFSTIGSVVSNIQSKVSAGFNAVRSVISSVISTIRSVISGGFNAALSVVSSVTSSIRSTVSSVFNALSGIVRGAMSGVSSAISSGMSAALSIVTSLGSSFKAAGSKIVSMIADGIRAAAGKVTGAAKNLMSKVRDHLPFSPAKVGPLTDIHRLNFGGPIGDSIENAVPSIQRKMGLLLEFPDQVNPNEASLNYAMESGRHQGGQVPESNNQDLSLTGVERLLQKLYDKDQSFYVNDEQLAVATNDAHDRLNGSKVSLNERWGR